jgi:hypothetical protein
MHTHIRNTDHIHNFTRGAVANPSVLANLMKGLTDEQIRAQAPSVFAEAPHGSRSDRYTYIPTAQLLAGLRKEGFVPMSVVQSNCRTPGKKDFTKHMLKLTHVDATALAKVGDSIPQICLTNSHDGSSTYVLQLGMWRLICSNGLLVCEAGFDQVRVPHIGDVRNQVIEGAFEVISQCKQIAPRIEAMRAVQLNAQEQEVFARQALQLRFEPAEGEQAPVRADQVLKPRRYEDQARDLWTTFNTVQENVIKGGQRYVKPARYEVDPDTGIGKRIPARRMKAREVKGIDQNTGLNRALWRLAEEMRALKSAA